MGLLDGKVVMVTGAAAGQGRDHVLVSVAAGAKAIAADVHPTDAAAYATLHEEVLQLGGELLCVQADVTDQASLDAAVTAGVARFGRVDAAVLNAGVHRGSPLWETEEDDWSFVLGVNLDGVWKSIKAVAPVMIDQGEGSIVVIASVDGIAPSVGSSAYGVSKAGSISVAQYAAAELGPHGIRVNTIAPGFVDTPMVNSQKFYDFLAGAEGQGTRQHLLDYGATKTALKGVSVLDPKAVANVALFLNSELASVVTGTVIPVDGGNLLLPHLQRKQS
ncbi:SDR family oxidoreductase [Mycetocola sp. 2940]|uniref:SDR family oxidoreductase n=1 Tax=Mycetocola sp. 2940 TaxID=3156452 RepID=UPI00339AF732